MIKYALSLAAGEGLAATCPTSFGIWPYLIPLALLVAFAAYGWKWRFGPLLVAFIAGLALYFAAVQAQEEDFREHPWLRNARTHAQQQPDNSPMPTVRVRNDFSRRAAIGLDPTSETVALNRAILLGERAHLPRSTKQIFVDSGTIHVFAISGLHVMIVAKIILFFVALFFVPYRWQGLVAMPFIWGYVVIIGAPPSALRAALMASFYFAAPVFWRRPDGLAAWSLAFILIHAANPTAITNVGSLFSFSVMLALIAASRVGRHLAKGWRQTLWTTFAAWAAGVPIAACVFGRLTPGGLLANLLLLPTAGWSVGAGACGILVSYVSDTLAAHFNNFAALFTNAMVGISHATANLAISNFEIPRWGFLECALWYVALALVFWLMRERQRQSQSPTSACVRSTPAWRQ